MKGTTGSSKTVQVLTLLDAYETAQHEAGCHWKASLWNLTKARHSISSGGLMSQTDSLLAAADVREELRPRAVLVSPEPELVAEEENHDTSTEVPVFAVADPVGLNANEKTEKETAIPENKGGLRHRKNANSGADTKTEWTVEEYEEQDEETRLCHTDPLELFGGGLNPKELKEAQRRAKLALDYYVQAANLKAAIEFDLKEHAAK